MTLLFRELIAASFNHDCSALLSIRMLDVQHVSKGRVITARARLVIYPTHLAPYNILAVYSRRNWILLTSKFAYSSRVIK